MTGRRRRDPHVAPAQVRDAGDMADDFGQLVLVAVTLLAAVGIIAAAIVQSLT
ncbi:hypothetical protein [Amycolatopsis thermophila]|uniref:Uncharacterized protein n=1 Tax=Amycolatopsis thermophila TaxID=206084 RepID=A0ABU0EN86_9PSEU|nr:hypothetical protein [Amycolatopsis thermophila]MDQ0376629.1 hypothetical protein [Amycolatopsis thermophila]